MRTKIPVIGSFHPYRTKAPVVRALLLGCKDAPAIPFVRVPDATAGDIQKATDIGALGVILPLVDAVEKIEAAVRYAKFPPEGVRSLGGGQYRGGPQAWMDREGFDFFQAPDDTYFVRRQLLRRIGDLN